VTSRILRRIAVCTVAVLCAGVLSACPRQGEGPAERVGKTMDKGVAKVGEGLEKAGEAIQGTAQGN
jgi:hypothetical protein